MVIICYTLRDLRFHPRNLRETFVFRERSEWSFQNDPV